MGTIGGNIANGSPIGDTPPALIALDSRLTLRKGAERRTISLQDFFIAYGKQDRQPGEFVEAVHVPVPPAAEKFAVYKVTKRRDEDITATLGAFRLALAADGFVVWRMIESLQNNGFFMGILVIAFLGVFLLILTIYLFASVKGAK